MSIELHPRGVGSAVGDGPCPPALSGRAHVLVLTATRVGGALGPICSQIKSQNIHKNHL